MKTSPHLHFESFRYGFTLIELLTVIAIIAVLMGLLFPAIGGVKNQARKAQAKNDAVQIVNAVKSYYTEYGRYPVNPAPASGDFTYDGKNSNNNNRLFNALRANGYAVDMNPRQIAFLEVPGGTAGRNKGGIGSDGNFYDPWGTPYSVLIDTDYDNSVSNPYSNAGPNPLSSGVVVWSMGKDGKGGGGNKSAGEAADDVLSWY